MTEKIVQPPHVLSDETIGIIAPAGNFDLSEFEAGSKILMDRGYDLLHGRNIFRKNRYLAGDDNERATDFKEIFADSKVKAVIAARGGYGASRILEVIDWSELVQKPKLFIGFSDNTFIHAALYNKLGIASIHGPNVCGLGKNTTDSVDWLTKIISGTMLPPYVYPGESINPGRSKGRIWGGNLTVICHMVGTEFLPNLNGHILFLEDVGEPLYRIDRALNHLKQSGILSRVAGVALGDFTNCAPIEDLRALIKEAFSAFNFPVIMGLPCGHGDRNLALPLGVMAEITGDVGELRVLESGLAG